MKLNFDQNLVSVFAKAYISVGFVGQAINREFLGRSLILILQNILAISGPFVLSVHFWFTFGFGDCVLVLVVVWPKVKNGVWVDH